MRGWLALPPALAILATAGVAAPPTPVYTEAQAVTGATLYAVRCAMCHGRDLEGTYETPALTGRFIANWSGAPLADLADYLVRAMPQFAPGTLTPEDKVALLAFLLKANALPAGPTPLPPGDEALQRIIFEPPPPLASRTEK